jgi:uncharacterized protein YxjI
MTADMGRFDHNTYLVRKKVLKLFGGAFHIFDPQGQVVLFCEMKAFKLKEDLRLYTGEDMQQEVLVIKARQILDFSSAYDVYESGTNRKIGALKRKGLKSMLKDEWILMDAEDREIGLIQEDNMLLALVRRFVINLIPQHYTATVNGEPVFHIAQAFNPFVFKMTLDFTVDRHGRLDRRLGMAAALLLGAIEGRQD